MKSLKNPLKNPLKDPPAPSSSLEGLIGGAGGPFSENQKSEKMRKSRRKGRERKEEEKKGKGWYKVKFFMGLLLQTYLIARWMRKKYCSCPLGPGLQNGQRWGLFVLLTSKRLVHKTGNWVEKEGTRHFPMTKRSGDISFRRIRILRVITGCHIRLRELPWGSKVEIRAKFFRGASSSRRFYEYISILSSISAFLMCLCGCCVLCTCLPLFLGKY